jgi:hypothetical protein
MIRVTDAIWFLPPVAATDKPVLGFVQGTVRSLMIDGGNCPRHAEAFLTELSRLGIA